MVTSRTSSLQLLLIYLTFNIFDMRNTCSSLNLSVDDSRNSVSVKWCKNKFNKIIRERFFISVFAMKISTSDKLCKFYRSSIRIRLEIPISFKDAWMKSYFMFLWYSAAFYFTVSFFCFKNINAPHLWGQKEPLQKILGANLGCSQHFWVKCIPLPTSLVQNLPYETSHMQMCPGANQILWQDIFLHPLSM